MARMALIFRYFSLTKGQDRTPGDAIPNGSKIGEEHRVERFLGTGGFGYIYLCERNDGSHVVLKECFPKGISVRHAEGVGLAAHDLGDEFEAVKANFREEARALSEVDHPNIVSGGALLEANGTVYLEMHFVEGIPLSNRLARRFSRLPHHVCKRIACELLDAVEILHKHGIRHKDISPDNIILAEDMTPVLIDFGSAEFVDRPKKTGTPFIVKDGYSPQEFYRGTNDNLPQSDIYQLGATLRHCWTGKRPEESVLRMYEIARGKPDPLQPLARSGGKSQLGFLQSLDDAMALFVEDRIATIEDWRKRLQ